MMHKSLFAFMATLTISMAAQAAVYKSVDANGQVVYSDTPMNNSKQVSLSPLHEYQAKKIHTQVDDEVKFGLSPAEVYSPWRYSHCLLLQPTDQTTLHNIGGILPIELELQPHLYPGDTLLVTMDGAPVAKQVEQTPIAQLGRDAMAPVRIGLTLENVFRGEHQIKAVVLRAGQPIASSNTVKIYVQQTSKLLKPNSKR